MMLFNEEIQKNQPGEPEMTETNCIGDIPRLNKLIRSAVADRLRDVPTEKLRETVEQDGTFHSTVSDLFRELCRKVFANHGIEKEYGIDHSKFNILPKDTTLSEEAQQAFNCICLIAGVTYVAKEEMTQSNTIELSKSAKVLSFKNDRWYLGSTGGEEFEILRSEADIILRKNGKISFITKEAWTDILKGNQPLQKEEN